MPGRADYIHHIADLLAADRQGGIPTAVDVLDIGCGANCIYPLIGYAEYGWRFTGSDINPASIASANSIVAANPGLQRAVRLRLQKQPAAVFEGIIRKGEFYHLTLCNPPFHRSAEEARQGSERKIRNLGQSADSKLNFSGQHNELWCDGGEQRFVGQMIRESVDFAEQVVWFSSLVSKKDNLQPLKLLLQQCGSKEVRVLEMGQGQKQSRILAWTFQPEATRKKRLSQR